MSRRQLKAGRLRHRLFFESLVAENDSDGLLVETWVPTFAVGNPMPAEVTPMSGREYIASQAVQSTITHRIKVRQRPGFVPKIRATERGREYSIEAVLDDPESGFRYVTLLASTDL